MKGLALYQKVNHFPGMFNIYRKNYLTSNLERMRKAFPDDFEFYPKTYILPNDFKELVTQMKRSVLEGDSKVFIAKPCDQSQGRGIFLVLGPQDIPSKEKMIVQTYINR